MKTTGYLSDDELILYVMRALDTAEDAEVATAIRDSEELQRRCEDIRLTLGMYATATVEPVAVPAGSFERLMQAITKEDISKESNVVQMPAPTVQVPSRRTSPAGLWAGWAVAAMLLLTAGWQFVQRRNLQQTVASSQSQLQQAIASADQISRERDQLASRAQQEAGRANETAAALTERSAALNQQVAAASARADQESRRAAQLSARVTAEAGRATSESARAAELATSVAAATNDREQLRNALSQQQDQVARAVEARQVLDALSDPYALRATLTVPKQKPAPSGRGTYVPNRGTLLFAASNLVPLRGGRVYELWLMPTDGSAPIPAGTFFPDATGNATLISTTFRKSIAAKGFAVTAEPAGGSTTPTLPILLAAL